jgi:hypothetical protein
MGIDIQIVQLAKPNLIRVQQIQLIYKIERVGVQGLWNRSCKCGGDLLKTLSRTSRYLCSCHPMTIQLTCLESSQETTIVKDKVLKAIINRANPAESNHFSRPEGPKTAVNG